jgi:hypothetical protein
MDPFSEDNIKLFTGMTLLIESLLRTVPHIGKIHMADLLMTYKTERDVIENDPFYRMLWDNTTTFEFRKSKFRECVFNMQPDPIIENESVDELTSDCMYTLTDLKSKEIAYTPNICEYGRVLPPYDETHNLPLSPMSAHTNGMYVCTCIGVECHPTSRVLRNRH